MSENEILKQLEEAFNYMAECKAPKPDCMYISDILYEEISKDKNKLNAFIDTAKINGINTIFVIGWQVAQHLKLEDRELVLVDE